MTNIHRKIHLGHTFREIYHHAINFLRVDSFDTQELSELLEHYSK